MALSLRLQRPDEQQPQIRLAQPQVAQTISIRQSKPAPAQTISTKQIQPAQSVQRTAMPQQAQFRVPTVNPQMPQTQQIQLPKMNQPKPKQPNLLQKIGDFTGAVNNATYGTGVNMAKGIGGAVQRAVGTVSQAGVGVYGAGDALSSQLQGKTDEANRKSREYTGLIREMGTGQAIDGGRTSFISQNTLDGKSSPVDFGKEFVDAGVQTASVLPMGRVLNGAQLASGLTKPVVKDILKVNAKQALVYGTGDTANDVLQGRGITPQSLAVNYGAPMALGSASEFGGVALNKGAKVVGDKATANATKAGEQISGLPKANVLNDNEAFTLSDFGDYVGKRHLTDTTNPNVVQQINQLQTQAYHAAKNAGVDIQSGSARDIQGRIADYLERRDAFKQGYSQVAEGGSVPAGMFDPTGGRLGKKPDVPKEDLIIKNGEGKAMSIDPLESLKQEALKYKSADDIAKDFGVQIKQGDSSRGGLAHYKKGEHTIYVRPDFDKAKANTRKFAGAAVDKETPESVMRHELGHAAQDKIFPQEATTKFEDILKKISGDGSSVGATKGAKILSKEYDHTPTGNYDQMTGYHNEAFAESFGRWANDPNSVRPEIKAVFDEYYPDLYNQAHSGKAMSERYVSEGGTPSLPLDADGIIQMIKSNDAGDAGSLSTYFKSPKLRQIFKDVIDTPVMVVDKNFFPKVEGGEKVASYLPERNLILIKGGSTESANRIVDSLLEEGLHALRNARGRLNLSNKSRVGSAPDLSKYVDDIDENVAKTAKDNIFNNIIVPELKARAVSLNKLSGDVKSASSPAKRSTFYDSLDVPKQDLIIKNGEGKAMSIEPKDLRQEASKYSSADDFIKSQGDSGKIDRALKVVEESRKTGAMTTEVIAAYNTLAKNNVIDSNSIPVEHRQFVAKKTWEDATTRVSNLERIYNESHATRPKPTLQDALEGKSTKIAPKEVSPTANSYAHEATPDEILNDTVDYWYKHGKETKGGQMIDTTGELDAYGSGIKRISEHNQFYSDFYKAMKRAPTKKDYEKAVRTQLEKGGGNMVEPDMATAYQLAKTRKAETDALTNVQDPTDYSVAFDGGVKPTIADALAGKSTKIKVKKETALSQKANQAPGDSKPQTVANASTYTKLNTNRIDLSKEAKNRIAKETSAIVTKLSNNEIKSMAKDAGIDFKSYGVEGTRKKITEQLNVRNEIFTIEKHITEARKAGNKELQQELMLKSAELGRISRSQGTDLGRQLQARRIIADSLATPQQKLYRLFDEAGVDPEVYTKRMADVDMTKPDEVVKAYRDLVPAKFSDWLDKYRYTNMLSSPLTHIVNITSNLSGLGGIAPIQKLVEGGIDAARSALTGSARTRYASEAGSYLKGATQSFPEAAKKFKDIMTGKQAMDMPDADALKYGKLANGGALGVADEVFSFIPKLLEASDQFGMTLVKAGEKAGLQKRMSKGVAVPRDLTGLVEDKAKYRVFRQELGASGQGHLLEAVDFIPNMLLQARNSKNPIISTIAKFTVPFVTTPTNLFKQGIEYSPAGVLTIAGNSDKVAQLAKMTMGTSVIAVAAGTLASQDAISFAEPSDAKQRDAFRAEGKQAYSIKIGDKWIQYSKLHPAIAFNLALVGGTKDALDSGAIDQPMADKILAVGGGVLGFFRDQSYMKSVGDFTSALELKDGAQLEDSIASIGGNWANQLVPFKSMTSWVGRMIDPTQRKTDYSADALTQIYQGMVRDIPGLNSSLPTRNNPYYKDQEIPLENPNPILNSFSPLRVSNDAGYGNTTGLTMTQRREMYEMPDEDKQAFRVNSINQKYLDKVAKEKGEETSSQIASAEKKKLDTGWMDEYNAAKSKFEKESKNWNEVERTKKAKELASLEVKKNFSKEATSLYDMAERDIYGFLDKQDDKKAQHYLNQIVDYGDKMVAAGLWSTNKLKDKYGNVQYDRNYNSKSAGGSKSTGTRRTSSTGTRRSSGTRTARGGSRSAKGKFDYKLFGFAKAPSQTSSDLYGLLKKAKMKRSTA